jgi:hypothetical protein
LLWPVHARDHLRIEIANLLEDCARLYRAVTDPATREKCGQGEFEQLRNALPDDWLRLKTALDETRSEPSFSRFNDAAYAAVLEDLNHLRQRLLAMCRDSDLYSHAGVVATLVPELRPVAEETARSFAGLAESVRSGGSKFDFGPLDKAEEDLDRRLQELRDTRMTSPFSLDRMLPFWSFLFNLKEIAGGVRALNRSLLRLF